MAKRIGVALCSSWVLWIAGCESDERAGMDGGGVIAPDSGARPDAAADGDDGGGSSEGGASSDSGAAQTPVAMFCEDYGMACGWSVAGGFTSFDDCTKRVEPWGAARRACADRELNGAVTDPESHCGAASGAAPCDSTMPFCAVYESTCGFGKNGRFRNLAECQADFASFASLRQACVETHLELAASDAETHCPHATGEGPCDSEGSFCSAYQEACGFGTDRFQDEAECRTRYGAFDQARQACVEIHVVLARQDANMHCPHATGAAPCDDATLFCEDYETICGFAAMERFTDAEACRTAFSALDDQGKQCLAEELTKAQGKPERHCAGAAGMARPCN